MHAQYRTLATKKKNIQIVKLKLRKVLNDKKKLKTGSNNKINN